MRGRGRRLGATMLVGAMVALAASFSSLQGLPAADGETIVDPAASPALPLRSLPGLRSVFVLVRLDVESLLGGAPIELVLGPAGARDMLLQTAPVERRDQVAVTHALALGRWVEFERVAAAVLGRADGARFPYRQVAGAAEGEAQGSVDGAALLRDRLVQRMAVLGYPPHLIADVVGGRIPVAALDQALRLRLLGRSQTEIARYLEEQAEAQALARAEARAAGAGPGRPAAARPAPVATAALALTPLPAPAARAPGARREAFMTAVLRSAARHRVSPDLVQAVIRHESDWNPTARSRRGALGLMQLMPDTARLLGVDPLDPEQNIDGGTRYLASLLALFDGNLDAAIIGYIGGPGYARTWLRGELQPNDEVRTYLQNVKTSYRSPSLR